MILSIIIILLMQIIPLHSMEKEEEKQICQIKSKQVKSLQECCLDSAYQQTRTKKLQEKTTLIKKLCKNAIVSELLSKQIIQRSSHIYSFLLQLSKAREIVHLIGHTKHIRDLKTFPDGRRIASGSFDQTLRIWDAQTGECLKTYQKDGSITAIGISPKEEKVIFATYNPLRIYSLNILTNEETVLQHGEPELQCSHKFYSKRHLYKGDSIYQIEVSPNGTIAFCSCKFIMYLFNSINNQKLYCEKYPNKTLQSFGKSLKTMSYNYGSCIAFFPDETKIAFSCDNTISIKTTTGENLFSLEGHPRLITALQISQDGKTLISVDNDQTIIWNATKGEKLQHLPSFRRYVTGLTIIPHQNLFLDSSGHIKDYTNGKLIKDINLAVTLNNITLLKDTNNIASKVFEKIHIYSFIDDELINATKDPLAWLLLEDLLEQKRNDQQVNIPEELMPTFLLLPSIIQEQFK